MSRIIRSSTERSKVTFQRVSTGPGRVDIWDRGTYELVEEKKNGGLTFRLHGERLEGTWTLIPAHLSGDRRTGS